MGIFSWFKNWSKKRQAKQTLRQIQEEGDRTFAMAVNQELNKNNSLDSSQTVQLVDKTRDFDIEGRKPVTLEELGIKPDKNSRPTRFSLFGEIIEDIQEGQEEMAIGDHGERYFRENNKEYFTLSGENVELHQPPPKLEAVNEYINYLIDRGLINLPKGESRGLIIREGQIPNMQTVGETHEYCGYHTDLNDGKKMIIIDERLPEPAKMAVAFHEFVHSRGVYDERETQLITIKGLKEMEKTYPQVVSDESSWGNWFSGNNDPDIITDEGHNPTIIRDALNYSIRSRNSFDVSFTDIKKKLRG